MAVKELEMTRRTPFFTEERALFKTDPFLDEQFTLFLPKDVLLDAVYNIRRVENDDELRRMIIMDIEGQESNPVAQQDLLVYGPLFKHEEYKGVFEQEMTRILDELGWRGQVPDPHLLAQMGIEEKTAFRLVRVEHAAGLYLPREAYLKDPTVQYELDAGGLLAMLAVHESPQTANRYRHQNFHPQLI